MSKEEVVRDHDTGERTVRERKQESRVRLIERGFEDDEARKFHEPKEDRVAGQNRAVEEGDVFS